MFITISCIEHEDNATIKMFSLSEEMEKMLISRTGALSIANINESVYKNTTDYELVGVTAEMNRRSNTKGEGIMHVSVAFVRYKNTSKMEVYDIMQPMHMLQKQEWKETLEQLKIFE